NRQPGGRSRGPQRRSPARSRASLKREHHHHPLDQVRFERDALRRRPPISLAPPQRALEPGAHPPTLRAGQFHCAGQKLRPPPQHPRGQLTPAMNCFLPFSSSNLVDLRGRGRGRGRVEKSDAFTLLELLIAVSIFALVLAALNGAFYPAMPFPG